MHSGRFYWFPYSFVGVCGSLAINGSTLFKCVSVICDLIIVTCLTCLDQKVEIFIWNFETLYRRKSIFFRHWKNFFFSYKEIYSVISFCTLCRFSATGRNEIPFLEAHLAKLNTLVAQMTTSTHFSAGSDLTRDHIMGSRMSRSVFSSPSNFF